MSVKNLIKRCINLFRPIHYTTVVVKTMEPASCLEGKTVLITGGGRGLGFYIAKRCISEGARVVITGRNEETLRKAKEQLGPHSEYVSFDIQRTNDIPKMINEASSKIRGAKINCLVSNAGISLHEGNFRNVTEDGWDRQINTNLKGNYFMVKSFVEYLEAQEDKSGTVVVITSERAKRSDDIPYGLTKVATSSFIQCMASKVIREGIRINGVGPGVTASDMTSFKRDGNLYASWQANDRIYLPEEVAEVVNFLLSDVSGCISGEIITCNEGKHISHW